MAKALRDIENVDEARAAIEAVIKSHELVIFTAKVGADGTKDCPFCIQILDALKAKGIAHKEQQVTS
jgi:glutaredoxin-related protein